MDLQHAKRKERISFNCRVVVAGHQYCTTDFRTESNSISSSNRRKNDLLRFLPFTVQLKVASQNRLLATVLSLFTVNKIECK